MKGPSPVKDPGPVVAALLVSQVELPPEEDTAARASKTVYLSRSPASSGGSSEPVLAFMNESVRMMSLA